MPYSDALGNITKRDMALLLATSTLNAFTMSTASLLVEVGAALFPLAAMLNHSETYGLL